MGFLESFAECLSYWWWAEWWVALARSEEDDVHLTSASQWVDWLYLLRGNLLALACNTTSHWQKLKKLLGRLLGVGTRALSSNGIFINNRSPTKSSSRNTTELFIRRRTLWVLRTTRWRSFGWPQGLIDGHPINSYQQDIVCYTCRHFIIQVVISCTVYFRNGRLSSGVKSQLLYSMEEDLQVYSDITGLHPA